MSELACDVNNPWVEYSTAMTLTVPTENRIVTDLPPSLEACRSSNFVLAPSYEVAREISRQ